jgi:pimeloyl-ACP methyl ester carboxylesterase
VTGPRKRSAPLTGRTGRESIHARRRGPIRGPRRPPSEALIDADLLRIPAGPGALHVARYGLGGTPVVFLHGFGTSSFLWREVAPAVALDGHTALAVDLLGHGESDRPLDVDLGIAAQAEYLDHALTALRVARAAIVGIDLGGAVALRLAATRPERVERLVLVNSLGFDDATGDDVRAVHAGTARFLFRVARGVLGAAPLVRTLLEGSVASPDHMPPRLLARYLAPFAGRDGVRHLLALARSVRAQDVHEIDPAAIDAPTLVVWGEADRWLKAGAGERLAAAIRGSRLVGLPDVGRLVPEEAPDELIDLLLPFLRSGTD